MNCPLQIVETADIDRPYEEIYSYSLSYISQYIWILHNEYLKRSKQMTKNTKVYYLFNFFLLLAACSRNGAFFMQFPIGLSMGIKKQLKNAH